MSRLKRIQIPGAVYHIFSRGNEKKDIFKSDKDRIKFIKLIKEAFSKYNFILHSYVLMPNHYHFLLESNDGNIGKTMHFINSKYSGYFNWEHKRTGHLFQGRYKSIIVEKDSYMIELIRYINLNPIRSRIVENITEYKWSSYHEYKGRKGFGITDTSWGLLYFGRDKNTAKKRLQAYLSETKDISDKMIEDNLMNGLIYGSREFTRNIVNRMKNKNIHIPKKYLKGAWIDEETILNAVAKRFEVKKKELISKKGKYNYGKKYAIYLLWNFTDNTVYDIAKRFDNVHSSGIKRIVDRMEKEIKTNHDTAVIISELQKSLQK